MGGGIKMWIFFKTIKAIFKELFFYSKLFLEKCIGYIIKLIIIIINIFRELLYKLLYLIAILDLIILGVLLIINIVNLIMDKHFIFNDTFYLLVYSFILFVGIGIAIYFVKPKSM